MRERDGTRLWRSEESDTENNNVQLTGVDWRSKVLRTDKDSSYVVGWVSHIDTEETEIFLGLRARSKAVSQIFRLRVRSKAVSQIFNSLVNDEEQ